MLMMSFDDALTRANFSFVYFLQFYLLNFFDIFQWGVGTPKPPSGNATACKAIQRVHDRTRRQTHRHTRRTDYSTRTTTVVSKPRHLWYVAFSYLVILTSLLLYCWRCLSFCRYNSWFPPSRNAGNVRNVRNLLNVGRWRNGHTLRTLRENMETKLHKSVILIGQQLRLLREK